MSERDDHEQFQQIEDLRRIPTVARWRAEILRVLTGEREFAILQLGSPVEYVENQIAASSDAVDARCCFFDGFEQLIQTWQPTRPEPHLFLVHMLDLLAAYTPLSGLSKLLGALERWPSLPTTYTTPAGVRRNLQRRALNILAAYYSVAPVPPANREPPFLNYVNLLRRHLLDSNYAAYAVVRLLELELLQTRSAEIGRLVTHDPQSVATAVSVLLRENWRSRVARDIGGLFSHSLIRHQLDRFRGTLKENGVDLQHGLEGPILRFADGETVELELSEEALQEYLEYIVGMRIPDSSSALARFDSKPQGS